VVGVQNVRRLGELAKVIDDGNAARADFFRHLAEHGRIDNRPMAAAQQAERQVTNHHLRAAVVRQPYVRDEDGQSAVHFPPDSRAVSHRPETETALASLHCHIFGRKTGFHFS
jgi:hypothetical protein